VDRTKINMKKPKYNYQFGDKTEDVWTVDVVAHILSFIPR